MMSRVLCVVPSLLSAVLFFQGVPARTVHGQEPAADGLPIGFPGNLEPVEMVVLTAENWDAFAPQGKEVDAIYGDIVLRNGELVAVIAAPVATRNANMTVGQVGGCLIDLTRRDEQSDQLSCYYPGQRRHAYLAWSTSDAAAQPLPMENLAYRGLAATLVVTAEAAEGQPRVKTSYWLTVMQPWVDVITEFSNPHGEAITVPLIDDVRFDGGNNEDQFKSPNGVTDLAVMADNYWQQAYGWMSLVEGRRIQVTHERASTLKFVDQDDNAEITLKPGETFQFARRIAPGRNLFEVRAKLYLTPNGTLVPVRLAIMDGLKRPIPGIRMELHDAAGEYLGAVVGNAEGVVSIVIPAGSYRSSTKVFGRTLSENVAFEIENVAKLSGRAMLGSYQPGDVQARITDEGGQPIPCKVEFVTDDGQPPLEFGPATGERHVKNLIYSDTGEFTQRVPQGKYRAIVSHGPEFDAIFTTLEVPPGGEVKLTGTLVRSVDTTGWVSSDFHSHSSPSGDNTSSQLGRVLNLLCEHIEFAPCTEHNRISSYAPHIEQLRIERFISTCSGMELTGSPLPLNHQNAFPLVEHRHEQDGGGPVPDGSPEVQMERLALWDDRSDKLVQQNHPDIGWLFFDKDGDGQPDEGFSRSLGLMDAVEVHPISTVIQLDPFTPAEGEKRNHTLFNWLQLLNQGTVITGVVNTDAHYNFHGSGTLRNWIASTTDDAASISPIEIVHAAEDGRLVMSNGPFLTMTAKAPDSAAEAGVGDDLTAPAGKVQVHVKVQCANWIDIDRVFLLLNGKQVPEYFYTRQSHPGMFGDGVVKFDQTVEIALDKDTHLIAVAASATHMLSKIYGEANQRENAAAVTNPIFIDVDGNGFTANQDTLGSPLPVRLSN